MITRFAKVMASEDAAGSSNDENGGFEGRDGEVCWGETTAGWRSRENGDLMGEVKGALGMRPR